MRRNQLMILLLALLSVSLFTQSSQAHPYGYGGVRIGIGFPGFYGPGPWYYGYGYPYYPYYYPPGYVVPARVVVQPAPAVVPAAPAVAQPVPSISPAPPAPFVGAVPTTPNVIPARTDFPTQDALLQRLTDPSEAVRRDAALDLGRMKVQRAVDPLLNMLVKDPSPVVREGAARGLGLIGSSRSLNALIFAAQADSDRDVRHSAQFSVEIIRSNLRGQ